MIQTKVKLYRWRVDKSISIHETGDNGFNLCPWGENTDMIQGSDDGGVDYDLPPEYELAKNQFDEPMIYRGKLCCSVMVGNGGPILVDAGRVSPVLKKSK